jgi:beta-galactosidase
MKDVLMICCLFFSAAIYSQKKDPSQVFSIRAISFNKNWLFLRDSVAGAEQSQYNDVNWRSVNLPHDWSIEDLPNQKPDTVSGPFYRNSIGQSATGFTVGETGWYRKKFVTERSFQNRLVSIHFDGVYMDSDVWLNGQHLGNYPYGYTPFYYDLTPYLKPAGQENVLSVRVRNEGKNSRWYSGSGIYRNVHLTVTEPVHVATWGVSIITPEISTNAATIKIKSTLNNRQATQGNVSLVTTLVSPEGKTVGRTQKSLKLQAKGSTIDSQSINLSNPLLWSIETPHLYETVTEIREGNKTIDRVETPFGIRSIQFDAAKGLLLNGKRIILKGGCIHHDNGPLGAVAINRAEERKIELLKKVGYNAVRISHNPPSQQLLDACDRLGMLVVNEAFDMWELPKNPQDYSQYFKEWWQKDLQALVLRDRNHPSIIMWSIGNEIFEASNSAGYRIARELADEVRRLDPTRAVTAAIVFLPGYTKKPWEEYEPYLAHLDVDGYNYFLESQSKFFVRDSATARRFETEHTETPSKNIYRNRVYSSKCPGKLCVLTEKPLHVRSL